MIRFDELCRLPPEKVTELAMTDVTWSFHEFAQQIEQSRDSGSIRSVPPQQLIDVAAALRENFGSDDWAREYCKTATAAGSDHVHGPPSYFIPFLVEIEGFLRDGSLLDDQAVERCAVYAGALALATLDGGGAFHGQPDILAQSAPVLADVIRLFVRAMESEWVYIFKGLLDYLISIRRMHKDAQVLILALPDLLEGIYVAMEHRLDTTEFSEKDTRETRASNMLTKLVEERMKPALDAWVALVCTKYKCSDKDMELRWIAYEHHRLVWQTVRYSNSQDPKQKWDGPDAASWTKLACRYDQFGQSLNAANTISGAIDYFVDVLAGRPEEAERFRTTMSELCNDLLHRIDGLASELPDDDHLELLRRCAQGHIAVKNGDQGSLALKRMVGIFQQSTKTVVMMRNSDYYVGIALSCDMLNATYGPRSNLGEWYEAIRGRPIVEETPSESVTLLQAYVYRTASALRYCTPQGHEWKRLESAHELARSLNYIHKQGRDDLEHVRRASTSPLSTVAWKKLMARICAQVGGVRVSAQSSKQILVEAYGHAVHIPWSGILIASNKLEDHAIMMRSPATVYKSEPPLLPDCQPILFLNEASVGDPWRRAVNHYADALDVAAETTGSDEKLQAKLGGSAASLIVLGCHGDQRDSRRELTIQIGDQYVPAKTVLKGLSLPRASTVLCLVCFAGGGQLSIDESWESLPEMFLQAGARAVVATHWPAWADLAPCRDRERGMLKALHHASTETDSWKIARVVTRWMSQQQKADVDPRIWAGWSVWRR